MHYNKLKFTWKLTFSNLLLFFILQKCILCHLCALRENSTLNDTHELCVSPTVQINEHCYTYTISTGKYIVFSTFLRTFRCSSKNVRDNTCANCHIWIIFCVHVLTCGFTGCKLWHTLVVTEDRHKKLKD